MGDALGVPVEFTNRELLRRRPVTDMIGYGAYRNLPPGTWSDDSSLTFCLAEVLTKGFDINAIGQNFVKWRYENYWTATGEVFNNDIATQQAIQRIKDSERPELARNIYVASNGNGSLMRIAPLVFYLLDKPINERFELTKQVSSITHGHIQSVIACFYKLEFARRLLINKNKFEIYNNLQEIISPYFQTISIDQAEVAEFDRLLKSDIHKLTKEKIASSSYVVHTLEASIWCLLRTNNYKDAVLMAVNLGGDTDTTAAVTGGLAGLLYGYDNIPDEWIQKIARKQDIANLAERIRL